MPLAAHRKTGRRSSLDTILAACYNRLRGRYCGIEGGLPELEAEQREEWQDLERRARERLRNGSAPARISVTRILQLLVLPTFCAPTDWEICRDTKATEPYFALRTVWHMPEDAEKLRTPVVRLQYPRPLAPTISVLHLPLDTERTEAAVRSLKSLVIPAMIERATIGLDGTSYELAFDTGYTRARYGWWHEPPEGWRPLHAWFQETLEFLEQSPAEITGASASA